MKKERLTLKKLEEKLASLKAARAQKAAQDKSSKKGDAVTSTPGIINFGTMQSSLGLMYLISIALYIIKNIPFVGKIVSGLSLYYGRAKVTKILGYLRKLFVLFNALIGVLTVYKLTGALDGSVVAGITGLGNTYIEIFTNFSKKVFDWFFDLFDQKIVPKTSDDSTSGSFFSSGNSTSSNVTSRGSIHGAPPGYWESLKKGYLTRIDETESISWYKDFTSIAYVIGGVVIAATVIGLGFMCYSYWAETLPTAPLTGTNKGTDWGAPRIDVNSPGGTQIPPAGGEGSGSSSSSSGSGYSSRVFGGGGKKYT